VIGVPTADDETIVPGDDGDIDDNGTSLPSPPLVNLSAAAPAGDRYSYVFDGNAQSLDHVLVNSAITAATSARWVEHPRLDADFPESLRGVDTTPARVSDHDPVVAFFEVFAFGAGDALLIADFEENDYSEWSAQSGGM
jgi:hypothetical protein